MCLAAHACGVPDVSSTEQISLMGALYGAEVAYQHDIIGEILDILQGKGLLENSWVVVTSDHGELFGERNGVYHMAGSHYRLLHVPLIIRPPGGVTARRLDAQVQPVDLFVTLLEVAGIPVPSDVCRAYRLPLGRENIAERKLCIAQTHGASIAGLAMAQRANLQVDLTRWLSWVDSVYDGRYLLEIDSHGLRGLYDVAADPDMNVNRLSESDGLVSTMVAMFEDWKVTTAQGDHQWQRARLSSGAW
jgi:arylsulfatase A-like enzyme